jgi:hypothetical protein
MACQRREIDPEPPPAPPPVGRSGIKLRDSLKVGARRPLGVLRQDGPRDGPKAAEVKPDVDGLHKPVAEADLGPGWVCGQGGARRGQPQRNSERSDDGPPPATPAAEEHKPQRKHQGPTRAVAAPSYVCTLITFIGAGTFQHGLTRAQGFLDIECPAAVAHAQMHGAPRCPGAVAIGPLAQRRVPLAALDTGVNVQEEVRGGRGAAGLPKRHLQSRIASGSGELQALGHHAALELALAHAALALGAPRRGRPQDDRSDERPPLLEPETRKASHCGSLPDCVFRVHLISACPYWARVGLALSPIWVFTSSGCPADIKLERPLSVVLAAPGVPVQLPSYGGSPRQARQRDQHTKRRWRHHHRSQQHRLAALRMPEA